MELACSWRKDLNVFATKIYGMERIATKALIFVQTVNVHQKALATVHSTMARMNAFASMAGRGNCVINKSKETAYVRNLEMKHVQVGETTIFFRKNRVE